ncbi:MAG: IclR family transcriptional regulator [Desulfobacterales bacterium]|nr:IclR family transcriptional regulator [Desulfobacterales bacterium]
MKTTTIQSLERGLKILDILGQAGKPLLLGDIAGHFSIDRSSVFRLVSTLAKCGYVLQDPETKRYSIGFRVLALSGAVSSQSRIDDLVRPVMVDIVSKTGQNTHLAILDGTEVVFIAVDQPTAAVSLNITVGTREPASVTALGKSLIAFMPAEERKAFLSGIQFKKYTPKSITHASDLELNLEPVRKDRLATDDEEYRAGIVCFAAPVFDHLKQPRYAIGISGLRDAIKPREEKYREIVRQAGIHLSAQLGFTGF